MLLSHIVEKNKKGYSPQTIVNEMLAKHSYLPTKQYREQLEI